MVPALIIIDLQNDFVSPDGLLKKKHIPIETLLPHLEILCALFNSNRWPIVIVRSEYSAIACSGDQSDLSNLFEENTDPTTEGQDDRTHTGKRRFCAPGSPGAEFPCAVKDLFAKYPSTHTITKSRYSAFANTTLHVYLQTRNVGSGPLYFAGVTANNCVLSSITSAFHLNYKVFALRDCIGATKPKLATESFKTIDRFYGSVIPVASLNTTIISAQVQQPRRILYWVSGSIPSWRIMMCLSQKGIPYDRKRLYVMSKPKDTRLPEFLAINSRGKTPTLIDDDGTRITESMAILEYLEMYYTTPALVPAKEDKERYKIVLQRFHESENLHNVFEDIELLFYPSWTEPHNRERVFSAYNNTLTELNYWENYLKVAGFVAGDEFTLADIAFYPNLAYLVHRGLDMEREGLEKLKEYCERVGSMQCALEARPVGYEKVAKTNLIKLIYDVLDEEKVVKN